MSMIIMEVQNRGMIERDINEEVRESHLSRLCKYYIRRNFIIL